MMRSLLLLFVLSITMPTYSQIASYNWFSYASPSAVASRSVKDNNDNIYILLEAGTLPITINSVTYTSSTRFIAKYNSAGSIVWCKPHRIDAFNLCLTADGLNVLVCGEFNSYPNGLDMGNGFTVPYTEFEGGIVYQLDGSNGNTQWVKTFDPPAVPATAINIPGSDARITAIDATANGIFITTNYLTNSKIRKLDAAGNQVWVRPITYNGNVATFENKNFNSYADDNGNTFFSIVSDNGNSTYILINGVSYPCSAVNRTYFSLDANGNTNWCRSNINFQTNSSAQVTRDGFVYVGGSNVYPNATGLSTNPFVPGYCSKGYNVFKAVLRNSQYLWGQYVFNIDGLHVANDGNTYISFYGTGGLKVGLEHKLFKIVGTQNSQNVLRINSLGETDSAFTSCYMGNSGNIILKNFFRTTQGNFIYSYNRNYQGLLFSNGLVTNGNATNTNYQFLVSASPAAIPLPHTTIWTGAVDGSWFTAANWTNGIPNDTSSVVIPTGATSYPSADNQFYNFSTNKWAACGTLVVNANVNYYLGYGVVINGSLTNNGNITYNYFEGFAPLNFIGFGAYNFLGNGSINYIGGNNSYYDYSRNGRNKIVINLNTATNKLNSYCNAVDALQVIRGNLVITDPVNNRLYVNNEITWGALGTGGSNAHVAGTLIQRVLPNQPLQLQVGNGVTAQPFTVQFNQTSRIGYLTASFSNSNTGTTPNPATCLVNGQPIASILNAGIWTITSDTSLEAGNGYTATARLKGSTNAASADRYALIKRSNTAGEWQPAGTYLPARDSAGYSISSATNISGFSDFAIGIASSVLPVKFTSFTAKPNGINALLHWTTASEINNSGFYVQHSADGLQYNNIAFINAGTTALGKYSFTHTAAARGLNYYRLQQVDLDGTKTNSEVKLVKFDLLQQEITVFPNPVQSALNFNKQFATGTTINIFNSLGQLVEKSTFSGNRFVPKKLKSGIYKLEIAELATGKKHLLSVRFL